MEEYFSEEGYNYLSGTYFDFYYKVSCIYRAVNFSACQPIEVISPFHNQGQKLGSLSLMNFNSMLVKEKGIKEIKFRIKNAGDDINEHFKKMVELIEPFREIAKNSRNDDLPKVIENANEIYEKLIEYGIFVESHIERLQERFFLRYPCITNLFEINVPNTLLKKTSVFNECQDKEGFENDLEEFLSTINEYSFSDYGNSPLDLSNVHREVGSFENRLIERISYSKNLLRDYGYKG